MRMVVAMCPICGQRDDLEVAQRIAGEHFLHQMIPDLQKLNKEFAEQMKQKYSDKN